MPERETEWWWYRKTTLRRTTEGKVTGRGCRRKQCKTRKKNRCSLHHNSFQLYSHKNHHQMNIFSILCSSFIHPSSQLLEMKFYSTIFFIIDICCASSLPWNCKCIAVYRYILPSLISNFEGIFSHFRIYMAPKMLMKWFNCVWLRNLIALDIIISFSLFFLYTVYIYYFVLNGKEIAWRRKEKKKIFLCSSFMYLHLS